MAANYQAIGTAIGSAGSITTLAWPTHIADDLGLLFVETSNQAPGGTWPPTGWTLIESIPQSTANTILYVLWQRAISSAMGNVTITDSGDHQYAVIMTIRGAAKTGNPIHAYLNEAFSATTAPTFGNSCVITDNSGTLSVSDFFCILAASWDIDNTVIDVFSNWTDYFSGGLLERHDAGTLAGNGGGIGIATKTPTNTTFVGFAPSFVTAVQTIDCAAWAIIIQPEPPVLGSGKKSAVASSC